MSIHPTSVISDSAKIDPSVEIGPFCIIGDDVEIGMGSSVLCHSVLKGPTKIGKNNIIYQFSSINKNGSLWGRNVDISSYKSSILASIFNKD